MTCRYSDANSMCTIYEGIIEMPGVDENGMCICEDDPDPSMACEEYEDEEKQR